MTNSSHPPVNLKEKENPDLPLVCSNYWPPNVALSLCFNHLVLSMFRQCRSAIPKRSAKPIASIHHTVQCPWRNPYVKEIKIVYNISTSLPYVNLFMPDSLFSATLLKQNYSCRVSSCTLCTSFVLIQDTLTAFFASEIPTSMEENM